ncbi:hypothetical protein C8A05DRAFT_34989, partial [Staphylotrichum tortipilum]
MTREPDRFTILVSLPEQTHSFPPRPSSVEMSQYGAGDGSPSHRFTYQAPGATTPRSAHQALPGATTSPAGPPTPAGRGSPQTGHPYPIGARRILTPRSPRAASLSRAAMRTVEAQHLAMGLQQIPIPGPGPAPAPRGPISMHDAPQTHIGGPQPLGPPPQFPSPVTGQGPAGPSPTRPTFGLSRSLSQPSLSHGLPSAVSAPPPEPRQQGRLKREHSGRQIVSVPSFPAPLPGSRQFGTPGASGEGSWGSGYVTSLPAGAARNFQISEGQPLLAITPTHGEEIVVAVDVHQGSRQADQKRQRNAGASARFRQRKKEKEREQQEELQKLENENRELERRNGELAQRFQDLESERDFYRTERNRLREALTQGSDRGPSSPLPRPGGVGGGPFPSDSPSLLGHHPPPPAQAHPQAPQHHHSASSFHSPLTQSLAHQHLAHSHPHPRSSSYGDIEPPARRRRTDSEPQLPTSSYSLMAPTPLP